MKENQRNIKTYLQKAHGKRCGDYTMEAARYIYDLNTIKTTKIMSNRVDAERMISKLKEFYLIAESASIIELQNQIQTLFDEHKSLVPNYYEQTEFSKRREKVWKEIYSRI